MKCILLVNLGTPDTPTLPAVKRYLKEFLLDPKVINLPSLPRHLLVRGLILPFRSPKTLANYQKIWPANGDSPLRSYTQQQAEKLQLQLGDSYAVHYCMRYGNPSLADFLDQKAQRFSAIHCIPLYPQYADSTTGSIMQLIAKKLSPSIHFSYTHHFYTHPLFIDSVIQPLKTQWKQNSHLLLSFHGLPIAQLLKTGCNPNCDQNLPCSGVSRAYPNCYRAQCYSTAQAIAAGFGLTETQYSVSFQSRLGAQRWTQPYTDHILTELYARGVRRLCVACPSFVSDCLETLEEINMGIRKQWEQFGDTEYVAIPCPNASEPFINCLANLATTNTKEPALA